MGGVSVTCGNCQRSFTLAVDASTYLLLELESRPCPYCDAYTLSTRTVADDQAVSRPSRVRRHRHLFPNAGDTAPDSI